MGVHCECWKDGDPCCWCGDDTEDDGETTLPPCAHRYAEGCVGDLEVAVHDAEFARDVADVIAHWPIGSGYYGTSIGADEANEIVQALAEAGLLRSDAEQAVIAAAERWERDLNAMHDAIEQATQALAAAVAALRAARKETP